MSIMVRRIPEQLTWANFIFVPLVINPNDGTEQAAFTTFSFDILDPAPRSVEGQLALAESFEIVVTPPCASEIGWSKDRGIVSTSTVLLRTRLRGGPGGGPRISVFARRERE